jgi:serine/threonine protein kinase
MAVRIENQAEPIPGYKLIERLGGGGFGEVWKTEAPGGLLKAIKFVYGDLETAGEEGQRAEQELKALNRVKSVRHPYILSLERVDIIDGRLVIVMELADRNLWDRFRECRAKNLPGIPRDELLGYMEEAAEALDLMNIKYQLQHLDIKPQNLFLVHNHAKVADFGLVKDLEGMMASVTGGVTPVYAAPETFDGWVSRFCDQYSLAIVYQELLTGQRPFSGTNVRQLILQHLQAAPNLTSLPPSDRDAVARALSKNPDERFPRCFDLVHALKAGSTRATPPPVTIDKVRPVANADTPNEPAETAVNAGNKRDGNAASTPPQSPPRPGVAPTGEARWIHVHEAQAVPDENPPPAEAVQEIHGDGTLFPALVLGLGGTALGVLQQLRKRLHEQFGGFEALPCLRTLYIDTNALAFEEAGRARTPAPICPTEFHLAKLNRPSHYLRSPEIRARLDPWFNTKLLYRIPRNLTTTGLRALGRLAFFDNYRLLRRRLRSELQGCTAAPALLRAAEETGLGLRSNRPRVYVVTGLAGGTGSGMFLDLAYVVRDVLRELGYEQPDVQGLFLLPPADRDPGRVLALGNAFAALTELHHFSAAGSTFTARYEEKEKPLSDPEPPFRRCIVLPLPDAKHQAEISQVLSTAADFLRRDLTTALGRAADDAREQATGPAKEKGRLVCQTFGLSRVRWPRKSVRRMLGYQLCQRLVQAWMAKDALPVREKVQAVVAETWSAQAFDGEQLMARLELVCQRTLGGSPEQVFAQLTEPVAQANWQELESIFPIVKKQAERIEQILGRPDETMANAPGELPEALVRAGNTLVSTWGGRLAEFTVGLAEKPEFRLAGAEETVRQVVTTIEQVLIHYEPLCKEMTMRVAEAQARLAELLSSIQSSPPGHRRTPALVANFVELFRCYPRWRCQSLILQRVVSVYVSLRGQLSDQLRELNFCRARLGDLRTAFENKARDAGAEPEDAGDRVLFPGGRPTLAKAVEQLQEAVPDQDLQDLDGRMQEIIQQQFTALVHVCLMSANLMKNLEAVMQTEAEAFADGRLAAFDAAELYLSAQDNDEEAAEDLEGLYEGAAPRLAGAVTSESGEICLMVTPETPSGAQVRGLIEGVFPDVRWVAATGSDDLVWYRELPDIELSSLEQLGPLGLEAYQQMSASGHSSPHNRLDIHNWRSASA